MQSSSRIITTNQSGIHPDLEMLVYKYMNSSFQKPVTEFNQKAFDVADQLYQQYKRHFILDSGCGVGESTRHIAKKYPRSFVLGIDRSEQRIKRNNDWVLPDNATLIRADLVDFWRLAALSNWQLDRHFLLYPNPWPKKKQLQRRWHGHPVFPVLKDLGGILELRTNWQIYAEEFSRSIQILTGNKNRAQLWDPKHPITPFERKYQKSEQKLYRVQCRIIP